MVEIGEKLDDDDEEEEMLGVGVAMEIEGLVYDVERERGCMVVREGA